MQILFQTYAKAGLHHKTPIPPPPLPLVHNPQVTLWVGRHYSPITKDCGANVCTIPLCNAQWKMKGGGEKEWQTATG